ncbi:hypothetical protein K491DRAFT_714645 [Lophiostoma macrostomum CBS 122681]|uniref:Uncharacterized protein n=1 Tax=Lophiostoma macrostomum CBS 122681 TaxID=1314788 RepID=A0A6A6TB92_9PLEO|nr:hypothetical protein K491DRAFT_714645 [Lophiostoma macrostomum CBS 122681]
MLILVLFWVLAAFGSSVSAADSNDTSILETRITTVVVRTASIWDRWHHSFADFLTASDPDGNSCMQGEACMFTFKSIEQKFNHTVGDDTFNLGKSVTFRDQWCSYEPSTTIFADCESCLVSKNNAYRNFTGSYANARRSFCSSDEPSVYTFIRDINNCMVQANFSFGSIFQAPILKLLTETASSSSSHSTTGTPSGTRAKNPNAVTSDTIMPTSSTLTAGPMVLPQSMLNRISPQGQWPYSTWGMARRSGATATYVVKNSTMDDEGNLSNQGAIILVPLQWNPRPLGKQRPLLQPSANSSKTNTNALKLLFNNFRKRDPDLGDCGLTQPCTDFFLSIEMAFNATGGIRDPNDMDQSRSFQAMWCGVNRNNTNHIDCIQCYESPRHGGHTQFANDLDNIITRFCTTLDPSLYMFIRDVTQQIYKVPAPLFKGPIANISTIAQAWHSESGFNQLPTTTAMTTTRSTDLNEPPTTGTTQNSDAPTMTLPATMLDSLLPLGQWPYTTWGMVRQPGHTEIAQIAAGTDRRIIATVVVPLQWFPRPLGKRQPLLLSLPNTFVSNTSNTASPTSPLSNTNTGFPTNLATPTNAAAHRNPAPRPGDGGDTSSPEPGTGLIGGPVDSAPSIPGGPSSPMTAPPSVLPSSVPHLRPSTWEAVTMSCSSCHEPSWIAEYRTLIFCEGWVGGT